MNEKPYGSWIKQLKACINENSALARSYRNEIAQLKTLPDSGPARAALWQAKREKGAQTRMLLLAYGYFRGRPYASIEPHTKTLFYPSAIAWTFRTALGLDDTPDELSGRALQTWLTAAQSTNEAA